jgi:hypothetical protein
MELLSLEGTEKTWQMKKKRHTPYIVDICVATVLGLASKARSKEKARKAVSRARA